VLNLVVDGEEVDRKPLGEGRPKGNSLEATVSARLFKGLFGKRKLTLSLFSVYTPITPSLRPVY
jgi:hypothetical protein